jgi:hypothetical protein
MAQLDGKITFGVTGATTEFHVGNPQGSIGQNPSAPIDAPIIGPKVQAPGGTVLNKMVGSTHIVNPA